jgi:alcohol dehydrogenase class IV
MISPFQHKPMPHIHFGAGKIVDIASLADGYGIRRVLLVCGNQTATRHDRWQEMVAEFEKRCLSISYGIVSSEPRPGDIDALVTAHRLRGIEMVIAIGGGSVLDAGKATAAMLCETEPVARFLEGVGDLLVSGRSLPFIGVPTTAGTGSEATSNAVIGERGVNGYKKSLRHDAYIPTAAVIDPELTIPCPPAITAACGMDCFTQLVEGYLSSRATPFTDAIALSGIQAVARSLLIATDDGQNLSARADMAYGALCSGLVLLNSGLGLVHGLAPLIGSRCAISHGVVCGALMAPVNEATVKRLTTTQPPPETLHKYGVLGRIFSLRGNQSEAYYQKTFIDTLYRYHEYLGLVHPSGWELSEDDIVWLCRNASHKNHPITLSSADIAEIFGSRR